MTAQKRIRNVLIGKPRDISDKRVFHRISLIAFFAWVGLGSDPLSSSCYGPEEIFRTLGTHTNLAIFAAILAVLTIFVISTSYRQIINLFPNGGGGYIVAGKLISPMAGLVSGSALLIDYVLTITISVSCGADAVFSFLPESFLPFKMAFALTVLGILLLINMRGVRESVLSLTPVFVVFIVTHIVLIGYGIIAHSGDAGQIVTSSVAELKSTISELGIFGALFLILKAYSMGAGTYTGIEAVSNGIPNLREPKVKTAQKTMVLLSVSLAIAVFGLMINYYLYNVHFMEGKTLNALLTGSITESWNPWAGKAFLYITLISEAALLFVAAQTGFLDGPRVMANMAKDNWLPRRFMHLSDRLVSQNGLLIMGIASGILLVASGGSVTWLVVLYSINVFITFTLSQFGMVRHWYSARKSEVHWFRKAMINGIGLIMTTSILCTVVVIKFGEGGWITLVITGGLILLSLLIKAHYNSVRLEIIRIQKELRNTIPLLMDKMKQRFAVEKPEVKEQEHHTAILLTNGYSSLSIYSFFKTLESFDVIYNKIVFLQIGVVDTNSLKGYDQVEKIKENLEQDLQKFTYLAKQLGLTSETIYSVGTDVIEEVEKMAPHILQKYPNPAFIGGQLIFEKNNFITGLLHNHTISAIQRKLHQLGIMTVIVPISLKRIHHMN